MPIARQLLIAGLVCALAGGASADPVDIRARFVHPDGRPIARLPVRILAGGEARPRSPEAGERMTTDADGRIARRVDVQIGRRGVALDNALTRHAARSFVVGVEIELVGRPALYWIELDLVRAGTLGGMAVYVQGPAGRFDTPLTFHDATQSWSIPGDPQGLLMSSRGAELKFQEVTGSAQAGWTVDLVIEKHAFTRR